MKLRFSALIAVPIVITLSKSASALGEYFPDGFASASRLDWIKDASVSGSYSTSYIVQGVNAWNGISSKVLVCQISSGPYKVRVTVENNATDPNVNGQAFPYCPAGSLLDCIRSPLGNAAATTTWLSAKVVGYENNMVTNGFTATNRIQVFTHEFGHALSMRHVASSSSVMYPYSPSNIGIQAYDKANLKAKWGN
jgi:Matrixin